jgi:hypothetical protein
MRAIRRWIVPCGFLPAFVSGWCHAQTTGSVTPEDEYKKLIKVNQDIQPLGAHPFGEDISLYDGTLSFEETDVSVPGNGPLLQLGRSLKTAEGPGYAFDAKRPLMPTPPLTPGLTVKPVIHVTWSAVAEAGPAETGSASSPAVASAGAQS